MVQDSRDATPRDTMAPTPKPLQKSESTLFRSQPGLTSVQKEASSQKPALKACREATEVYTKYLLLKDKQHKEIQ